MNLRIAKVDESLGLVFGWAVVSKVAGVPYVDLQGDHVPEDVLLRAAADFMAGDRPARVMHGTEDAGQVVFAWPLTADIAEAMGVETGQTGLMIGMRPDDPETLRRFRDGAFKGFSIGGRAVRRVR